MPNSRILYLEAEKRDFVNKFLANNPGYWLRDDGKIDHHRRMHPDPPWCYIKPVTLQNCHFYHKIYFAVITNSGKVPIYCQKHCWKVVIAPRNLQELFALRFFMLDMDRPAKCGMEMERLNSDKLYGGYFYNTSMEEGLECFDLVKKKLHECPTYDREIMGCRVQVEIEPDIPIILKRACTEFEQNCGPADEWGWDEDQEEFERFAMDAFVMDFQNFEQSDNQLGALFVKWIHAAYRIGDKTYLKFCNDNELFAKCVTFHDRRDFVPDYSGRKQSDKEVEENGKERTQQRVGSGVKLHQDQREPARSVNE
ncbi:MAG: hypothetical protein ACYSW3_00230 [Planctomycetota bacterium]|jgi:hypothetical protein